MWRRNQNLLGCASVQRISRTQKSVASSEAEYVAMAGGF